MKIITGLFVVAMVGLTGRPGVSEPDRALLGMFDGRTPCRELAMHLEEKTKPECIKIKWRLWLFKDAATGAPAGYEIVGFVFNRDKPRSGNWKILKGTFDDPDATVYELEFSDRPSLLFQKADDNILFFLNKEKKLLVGNQDFSYTLNRVPPK